MRNSVCCVVFAAQFVGIVVATAVNFTDCGTGNVKSVDVNPCPTEPCQFKIGTRVDVRAEFVANSNVDALQEILKGHIKGRDLPFPEPRRDPCTTNNILPACPLKSGELYVYKNSIEIKPFYPAIPLKVKYLLSDRGGKVIACVQVDANIEENSELTENTPK